MRDLSRGMILLVLTVLAAWVLLNKAGSLSAPSAQIRTGASLCTPDSSPQGIPPSMAQTLGDALTEADPLRETISRYLRDMFRMTDLFEWNSGAAAAREDQDPGFDLMGVDVVKGVDALELSFTTAGPIRRYPSFFKGAFNMVCGGRCGGSWPWQPGVALAQGQQNPFGGPNFSEDVIVFARLDGPGRTALRAVVGTAERPINGTVEVGERTVRIRLPLATVVELGLASPGIRVIFGLVGPPPKSIYDRVPERGSIQLGVARRVEVETGNARARFDLNGDGRPDLFYLDTNGNGLIDAAGRDVNGNGQLELMTAEGPGLFIGREGQPLEFADVERKVSGRRQTYVLESSQLWYLTVVEDRNGDGDVDDAGEFRSLLIVRR